jgi:catechol 2,3-dioxygenase-like lactoylglutathione lyase family enzyme
MRNPKSDIRMTNQIRNQKPETNVKTRFVILVSGFSRIPFLLSNFAGLACSVVMLAIDHVQLAIPLGGEAKARWFFVEVLGMREEQKPAELAARGGCWFRADRVHIHCGVESLFVPQKKAHPAFLVRDIAAAARALAGVGLPVLWDETGPARRRFYCEDPFGNRLEFIASGCGFSEQLQPLVSGEA